MSLWQVSNRLNTVGNDDLLVVAGSLVCFVLPHQREELFGGPALGLEIIVIRGRGASVHLQPVRLRDARLGKGETYHEVDG